MDEEPALLHEPDLMLALLRAAGEGPAGPDEAAARLLAILAAAGEPAPADPAGLRRRLGRAAGLLTILPAPSTTHTRLASSDTPIPAKYPTVVPPRCQGPTGSGPALVISVGGGRRPADRARVARRYRI